MSNPLAQTNMIFRRTLLAGCLLLLAAPALAQEGSEIPNTPQYRGTDASLARGVMDGNLLEMAMFNYGQFASIRDPFIPGAVYPRGTRNRHIDGYSFAVSAQVLGHRAKYPQFYGGRGDTVLNPVIIHYIDGKKVGPNGTWGWLPIPGFHDPLRFSPTTGNREATPALSDDVTSWPSEWPDKLADAADRGWRNDEVDRDPRRAAWNGFFGKGVQNADLETFFVVDDHSAWDYAIDPATRRPFSPFGVYYPNPSDSTMGGLGMQVQVRAFQWGNVLAEDLLFMLFRVTNVGQETYGDDIALPCFQGKTPTGERVIRNPCTTGIHLTQWADYGMGFEEGDEGEAYNPQLDIAYGWDLDGIGTNDSGSRYQLGYAGFAFLESPVNRDDVVDNDEDGVTDEGRFSGPGTLVEGQAQIVARATALGYNLENFQAQIGALDVRQAYRAGRWWTGDEDMDWVGFSDLNGNGRRDDGELVNDDVGSDGLGPFDLGYGGPDPDSTESNGRPDAGEPNFDQTDIEEGDQIGLTGIHLAEAPFYFTDPDGMERDEWMWERIVEHLFPVGTKPAARAEGFQPWIVWNSGLIKLAPQQTDFFSSAMIFGADLEDFLENRRVAQSIYDTDYRFAQPPIMPRLTAREGDGFVVLTWDTLSLGSYDRFTQTFDFEGFKLYRGTDPLLTDARTITDFRGNPTFYEPIAEWDLVNDVTGRRLVLRNSAVYDLGTDKGLEFAYIDRDVTNGKTYYYALVAYDHGFVPTAGDQRITLPIDPQENIFRVSVNQAGQVTSTTPNVAVVTPRSRAAGYVEAGANGDLSRPTGTLVPGRPAPLGSGSIEVTVVSPDAVPEGAVFQLSFDDSASVGNTYVTTTYTLRNATTGATLLSQQEIAAASPVAEGIVINFNNDETGLDLGRSGYVGFEQGTGQPAISAAPQFLNHPITRQPLQTNWRVGVALDPTGNAEKTSDSYELRWTDDDSLYQIPRFSAAYPRLEIPVWCKNTSRPEIVCDLLVDDLNDNEEFDVADQLIIAEKECRTCVHKFRFDVSFTLPGGTSPEDSRAPEPGARIEINQFRPFAEGDFFQFTVNPAHYEDSLAVAELERIKVVPNPYVAAADWEPQIPITGRGPRMIQFTHLPERCTIRIFTMRGELVDEIEHVGTGGDGSAWWDLKTRDDQEVAYGIYLYHVDAPDLGQEITGKFAIIK